MEFIYDTQSRYYFSRCTDCGRTGSFLCVFHSQTVYITADGEEYAYYPLSEDRTVTIERSGHINKITIKDGQVSMTFSDCSGQDCIQQGKISQTSQSITCLPNRIVIEIRGDSSEYDAVVR